METLNINLSSYPDRFSGDSFLIDISEKVNFIYGKNGTGKSTIAKKVVEDFSENYKVVLFDGFESVVGENHRLDAISLGSINTEIQKKIDLVSDEISNIKLELEDPESDQDNIYSNYNNAHKKYQQYEKEIRSFYTDSARIIKNKKIDNVNIATPSYNKDSFLKEIDKSKKLTEKEVSDCKDVIKSDEKKAYRDIEFPVINLRACLDRANLLIERVVTQKQIIEGLNTKDKEEFVRIGLQAHKHKAGEICAFCGNPISEDRWLVLAKVFNDDVKKLENEIDKCITDFETFYNQIPLNLEIDYNKYHKHYKSQVLTLNLKIKAKVGEYFSFLSKLINSLKEKKKNIFEKPEKLTLELINGFEEIQTEYNNIIVENNLFSENLIREQDYAKDVLRYNEIESILDNFNYYDKISTLRSIKTSADDALNLLDRKREELNTKLSFKNELILQTVNEELIAKQINNKLSGMGVSSFSLKLVQDDDQKGQYQIKGHNGSIRSITQLSKGEKNIIAFLYFLLSIDKVNNDLRPKIILLDDPMTSNDDTMQYLMISELQNYYRKLPKDSYILIFTHNCHFYLNIRPNTAAKYKSNGRDISHYEKYGNYHMYSDGKLTLIKKIKKGKHDFRTNYEMLWRELNFLYNSNEPNLMLNVCRKIIETYIHFTKKDVSVFYNNNLSAKKLFDVNQHAIDDLEAEQNGRTKDDIIKILKTLFDDNNANEHFSCYFKNRKSI